MSRELRSGARGPRGLTDGKHRIVAIVLRAAAEPRGKQPQEKGAGHQTQAIWALLPLQSSRIVWPPRLSLLLKGVDMARVMHARRDGSPAVWSVF
jgi:hypothetical protein